MQQQAASFAPRSSTKGTTSGQVAAVTTPPPPSQPPKPCRRSHTTTMTNAGQLHAHTPHLQHASGERTPSASRALARMHHSNS
eukprot:11572601-Alexandrium_andersonii.AAC.1